jgi:Dehydratase family
VLRDQVPTRSRIGRNIGARQDVGAVHQPHRRRAVGVLPFDVGLAVTVEIAGRLHVMPIPTKLVKQGVRDMLRISDARMSGTSYGACILHVSPESYIGGPLAFVQTGDAIEVDVAARSINLVVSDEEMARRKAAWTPPPPRYQRGYGAMFSEHIGQADEGCDFDFLARHVPVAEPEIH